MDYIEKSISALHKIVINELTDPTGVHAETAVATLAGLVGVRLLVKTYNENIHNKEEFLENVEIEGKKLFSFLIEAARQCGLPVVEPVGDIPSNHYPKENSSEIAEKLWPRYCKLLKNNDILPQEQQDILILALLQMIKMTSEVLEPRIGMTIAMHEIVKISKSSFFIKKLDILSRLQEK